MLIIFNIILLLIGWTAQGQVRQCRLLVADTPEKHEKGLMHMKSLVGYDGMVFLYKDRMVRHFWNKNTHLELYVYWIDGSRLVGRSYLPPEERAGIVIVSSPEPVDTVVELLKGRRCMYKNIPLSP
ncbi:DUF192 domain-containing protein [Pampinifervens florentissimum]|uniref:DUF192 domain-containing protein n=1 Tax=Pampinifervens florentissimum TaxID=1632019 RepID=UPI0013B4839E|nr:DUF192 domain-containing protein [Hydrogenobacter sp. T-8]QID32698.1 hypothetical protein G3M65_02455 [Hydrogenobacter sp. T-8]